MSYNLSGSYFKIECVDYGLKWFVDQETEKSFDEVHLRLNLGFVDSRCYSLEIGRGALLEKNSFVHLFLLGFR